MLSIRRSIRRGKYVRRAGCHGAPPNLPVLVRGLALIRWLIRIPAGLTGALRQLALAFLFHLFLLLQFFLALLKLIVWFGQRGALFMKLNRITATVILRLAGNHCALNIKPGIQDIK